MKLNLILGLVSKFFNFGSYCLSFIEIILISHDFPWPTPKLQAPVVQRLDNAIHWISRYPADKYWQNKPRYPLDSDLSGGQRYPAFEQPGPGLSRPGKWNYKIPWLSRFSMTCTYPALHTELARCSLSAISVIARPFSGWGLMSSLEREFWPFSLYCVKDGIRSIVT